MCVFSLCYPACKAHAPYCIVIGGLYGCAIFFHISHVQQDFLDRLLNVKCLFWFCLQLLSETSVILRRTEPSVRKKMRVGLQVKCPLLLSSFNEIWNFLGRFSKNNQISDFLDICTMGAEFFHAGERTVSQMDRRTVRQADIMKLVVSFRQFANTPKISAFCPHSDYFPIKRWPVGLYNGRSVLLLYGRN